MGPEAGAGTLGADAAETTVYVGLGSNLANPAEQIARSIVELGEIPGCRLIAASALFATVPVGPVYQPEFVNAAARLVTRHAPSAMLAALQAIERDHGRVRDGTRWGPRTLDLDLLLFGDLTLRLPGLTIPHPEIANRAFVLVPLAEIAPDGLVVPGQGRLGALLDACGGRAGVRRLSEPPRGPGRATLEPLS